MAEKVGSGWWYGRVVRAERLRNTRNGGPRWQLRIDGVGTLRTAADSSDSYAVDGSWVGRGVRVHVNGRGTVDRVDLSGQWAANADGARCVYCGTSFRTGGER